MIMRRFIEIGGNDNDRDVKNTLLVVVDVAKLEVGATNQATLKEDLVEADYGYSVAVHNMVDHCRFGYVVAAHHKSLLETHFHNLKSFPTSRFKPNIS
ncbi:hypothetical protein VNO78_22272 [Psophocarpus tetragonolobus]|uniref:Uncharacterized protein n=1 Tax=Psophocarpus tetragonolobus TaxID=3891 RepID=A0AAN9SGR0_PSOTE